jgi:hypothetical protein
MSFFAQSKALFRICNPYLCIGYEGDSCNQCMAGWNKIKNGTLCGITTIPENFIRSSFSKNSTYIDIETKSENNTIAIIISATLLSIMAYYLFRWWKNVDQRHAHQRLNNA